MAEVKKRDSLRTSVTRMCRLSLNAITAVQARVAMETLELYYDRFLTAQLEVDEITGPEFAEIEEIGLTAVEQQYLEQKSRFQSVIDAAAPQPITVPPAGVPPVNENQAIEPRIASKMKIKEIELPKFSGEYRKWTAFSNLFLALVGNDESIPDAQKLYLLKAHLTGDALLLIDYLEVTAANYTVGWNTIERRYNNKRIIVESHIESFLRLPKMKTESAVELRQLVDKVRESTGCLEALNVAVNGVWDPIMTVILKQKLDVETQRCFEISLENPNELVEFEDMLEFLDARWRAIERCPMQSSSTKFKANKGSPSTLSYLAAPENDSDCVQCEGDHDLEECEVFRSLSYSEKREKAVSHDLCFKCLRPGHSSMTCTAARCTKCRGKHHILLHTNSPQRWRGLREPVSATDGNSRETAAANAPNTSGRNNEQTTNVSALHSSGNAHGILSTAIILVKDCLGKSQNIRVLLDSGSEATFITEQCVQRLRLPRRSANISVSGVGTADAGFTRGAVTIELESKVDRSFKISVNALILKKLTNLVPRYQLQKRSWPHFNGITFADAEFDQPGRVDMLIGADIYGGLLINGLIPSYDQSPVAQNTRFGWILMGQSLVDNSKKICCNMATMNDHHNLEEILKRFWEMESVDQQARELTNEEKTCEDHFENTYTRDSTGRFIVRLPLIKGVPLGDSKRIALKRFYSTEKRIDKNSELKAKYISFMKEYAEMEHMVPALNPTSKTHYYLPHHCIEKESSSTTKLRVVFDASCKTTSGNSLNDAQLVGPKLQDDLYDTVLRFRLHKVALSADISKMYRQVLVHQDDHDLQRVLWRDNAGAPVQEWCLRTVTYGMASAPFLAIRSLRKLAEIEKYNFSIASKVIYCPHSMLIILSCGRSDSTTK